MRKSLVLVVAALSTAGIGAIVPTAANAACTAPASGACGDTPVTFNLTGGTLAITVPASKDFGNVALGGTSGTVVQGPLGSTTVTDTRGALVANYSVVVTSSNFTTGGAGPTQTVLGSTVTAWSDAVAHTNAGVVTSTAAGTAVPAIGVLPILTNAGYSGTDTATYTPSIKIVVPATNVAGAYSGTITQTVS